MASSPRYTTRSIRRALLGIAFSLGAVLAHAASPDNLRESLRGQVFNEAHSALGEANRAHAAVLAPNTYRDAADDLQAAQAAFNDGRNLDDVRRRADAATTKFAEAKRLAGEVLPQVSPAFQARQDALEAGAKDHVPELWVRAAEQIYEATSRAERGRKRGVERYTKKAEELFREAELEAIELALFTEVDREIAAARRLDADDWAPQSYSFAVDLLSQARAELAANRYDTDRPRDLARQALHYAMHAKYVARLADDVDDGDRSLESILMDWEANIARLGEALDVPVYFDNGPAAAIGLLLEAVERRRQGTIAAEQSLVDSQGREKILTEELSRLQADLEGQALAEARLNERLLEQQRRNEKLRRIETMFTPDEAQVLRASDRLVVRLVGLGFASGSATLEPRHYELLGKLETALAEFPEVPFTIEGHTDSHGMDSTNQQLSVARAEAVASYLLANAPLSPANVSAIGYGEDRPIANNETADGRAKNRRIDVVLYL